jgi:succinyl-CoA synthetase beta subunit
MDIHEFQAKLILHKYGILTPPFAVASSMNEVEDAIEDMALTEAILKVQVHAGGRGKAGGVKLAQNPEEIIAFAEQMFGMRFTNNQTSHEGIIVHQILITPYVEVKKEYYLGAVIDRYTAKPMLIASPEGGMNIEDIAEDSPEKILTIPIPPNGKLRSYQLLRVAKFMGWEGEIREEGKEIVQNLAKAFIESDASTLEINPLVLAADGRLLALDAKLSVDDNALYRQPIIREFYDPTQSNEYEAMAHKYDLAYIALDGEIGCMVNGAGLAMATLDLIYYCGGNPANFLDVGGGATKEKIAEGFKILLSDPKVKAILINIFGGIMNCETLAAGIISAAHELKVRVPLMIRMEGTNVKQGKKMLAESGLNIKIVNSLSEVSLQIAESRRSKGGRCPF